MKIKEQWTRTTTTYVLAEPIEAHAVYMQTPIHNITMVRVSTTDIDEECEDRPEVKVFGRLHGNRNSHWQLTSVEDDELILRELKGVSTS